MLDARLSLPRKLTLLLLVLISAQTFLSGCWYSSEPAPPAYTHVGTIQLVGGDPGEPFGIARKDDVTFISDGEAGTLLKIDHAGQVSVFASGLNTPSAIAFLPDGD